MYLPVWLVVLTILFASLGVWTLIFVSKFVAMYWTNYNEQQKKKNDGNPTV